MRYIIVIYIVINMVGCHICNKEEMVQSEKGEVEENGMKSEMSSYDSENSYGLTDTQKMQAWLDEVKEYSKKNKEKHDKVQWYYIAVFFYNVQNLNVENRKGRDYILPERHDFDFRRSLESIQQNIKSYEDAMSCIEGDVVGSFRNIEQEECFDVDPPVMKNYLLCLDKWLKEYEWDWQYRAMLSGKINKETIALRDSFVSMLKNGNF